MSDEWAIPDLTEREADDFIAAIAAHPTEPEASADPRPLHPSHRWGQRPVFVRKEPGSNVFTEHKIPCCLNCLVDGYEDEPDAFAECRRQGARDE